MGAVLEEGGVVGSYSMVGAGSVVQKGQQIPSGEVSFHTDGFIPSSGLATPLSL